MKFVALGGLLALVGSFASLGSLCDRADAPYSPFAGSSRVLTAMGEGESLRMVADTPPITLEFLDVDAAERVKLTGDTGCNSYTGAFEVTYESVEMSMPLGRADVSLLGYDGGGMAVRMVDFEITQLSCFTRDLVEREVEYRDTLATARSAMLAGPRLIIEGATGGVLVLDRRQ